MRTALLISMWLLSTPVAAAVVWDGPRAGFSKPAFADAAAPQNQDRLTDGVWITRGNTAGLFNIRTEQGFVAGSPADTEWAFAGLNGNPANVSAAGFAQLVFADWASALGGSGMLAFNILDRPGVVHLITDDIYIDIVFTNWGRGRVEAGGAFAYERSTPGAQMLSLMTGLNLYAPSSELGGAVDSCFGLLASLGGPAVVASVASLDADQQLIRQCEYLAGNPAGDDFAVTLGIANFVDLLVSTKVPVGSPGSCPPTVLAQGINLVGVALPADGLTCYGVLDAFGEGVVSAIERLDASGAFEWCATAEGGVAAGSNFRIAPGVGYILHAKSAHVGINLNELSNSQCVGDRPEAGP